jgi:hypothetical protein
MYKYRHVCGKILTVFLDVEAMLAFTTPLWRIPQGMGYTGQASLAICQEILHPPLLYQIIIGRDRWEGI